MANRQRPQSRPASVLAFIVVGAATTATLALALWFTQPALIAVAREKLSGGLSNHHGASHFSASRANQAEAAPPDGPPLPPWTPHDNGSIGAGEVRIDNRYFDNLAQGAAALRDGDTLLVGAGVYHEALVIRADNVTLLGQGLVVLDGRATQGKGAIVIDGNNVSVRNIECRNIRVRDNNGACIRLQGENLSLEHVYFHDSQQGILTGPSPGRVQISDSRFERLGHGGYAHGIYIGGGSLLIENSLFLRSKGQGHEIKSRAVTTKIYDSVIASLDGEDSRLIDLPHGGDIAIERCVLEQGPNSANYNLIGVGLERGLHVHQKLVLRNNIIIMERIGINLLLQMHPMLPAPISSGNLVIGGSDPKLAGQYVFHKNRETAKLKPYPFLPKPPGGLPTPDILQ